MVKINKIYTRTGDDGSTGLVGGKRVRKDSLRIEAIGDVDELNSIIGIILTTASKLGGELPDLLAQIQNELFDVGALLATDSKEMLDKLAPITSAQVSRLEHIIDAQTKDLPELRSFVLPGGTELNAFLHLARAVCRRAERRAVKLAGSELVAPNVVIYLNRLSDLLFAMARAAAAKEKVPEYLWVPGKGSN